MQGQEKLWLLVAYVFINLVVSDSDLVVVEIMARIQRTMKAQGDFWFVFLEPQFSKLSIELLEDKELQKQFVMWACQFSWPKPEDFTMQVSTKVTIWFPVLKATTLKTKETKPDIWYTINQCKWYTNTKLLKSSSKGLQ